MAQPPTPSLITLGRFQSTSFHLLTLPTLTSPWPTFAGARHFRLVVFLDKKDVGSVDDRRTFIENALNAGARSILCGGSYCSELHDEFDTVLIEHEIDGTPYCDDESGQFIVTTWHDDEPADEILWQAATGVGHGCDDFESDSPHIIVVALATEAVLPELRRIGSSLPDSLDCVVDRD